MFLQGNAHQLASRADAGFCEQLLEGRLHRCLRQIEADGDFLITQAWRGSEACPTALSHGIGSDSQRPFAIVIVDGLISDLVMSIFLLPTLYVWMAREHDVGR